MATFAENAIEFYSRLNLGYELPEGVSILNPYADSEVQSIIKDFFQKYYNDERERLVLLGINPGRYGAGVTGITFTDPERLERVCEIPNTFEKRSELSSRFIYDLIQVMGGPEKFYSSFYLSAVSPIGFVRSGKNLNYYDDKDLEQSIGDFIISCLKKMQNMGVRRDRVICLGEGKNYRYLQKINQEHGLFDEILALPHPRWIMQYRFRKKEEFLESYVEVLTRD